MKSKIFSFFYTNKTNITICILFNNQRDVTQEKEGRGREGRENWTPVLGITVSLYT